MRSPIKQGALALLALGLLAGLTACGSSGGVVTPGVSSGTITVGSHQPLTGPAAPGYSEIAAASQAFFDYVNAHGGVYGRSIQLIALNDAYNPTQTTGAVKKLVLYDSVFGIFEGLGTATHARVAAFLNHRRVPDVFVGSGCPCWENAAAAPYTFGWQPSALIEAKILGWYIHRRFPRLRVGVLYQDDAAGRAGLAGLRQEIPAGLAAAEPYTPGATRLTGQIEAIRAAGARVLVDFTLPAYTAIGQLTSLRLHYRPRLVVWSGGIDPRTVGRLLSRFSAGQVRGDGLIRGSVTDAYLPAAGDTSNRWVRLFKAIGAKYDPKAPFDSNVEYGMASAYTFVQALRAAGRNLTREGLVGAIARSGASWRGPGLVPLGYSSTDHGGFRGAQLGRVEGSRVVLFGRPLVSTPGPGSPVRPYRGAAAVPPRGGIPR